MITPVSDIATWLPMITKLVLGSLLLSGKVFSLLSSSLTFSFLWNPILDYEVSSFTNSCLNSSPLFFIYVLCFSHLSLMPCQDTRSDSFFLSTLPTSKDLFIFKHFDCHYPLWDYTSLTSFEIRFFFCSLSSATVFNCCCLLVLLNWPRQNCIPYGKTFNFVGYLFAPTHLQYILDSPRLFRQPPKFLTSPPSTSQVNL